MTPADLTGNEIDFNSKRRKKNMKNKSAEAQEDYFDEAEASY